MHQDGSRDLDVLRAEVSELRSELDAMRSHPPASPPRRFPRFRRSVAVLGVIAVLVALPVAVSASHIFTDVPDSNMFHSNISNLYGSRITTGCSPTTYCPNDPVTRGSMAAFLNRGLGRAAADANLVDGDDWATLDGDVAAATLQVGGSTGGTAHVLVEADLNAWTDENGVCPCELEVVLWNSATLETSVYVYAPIVNELQTFGYYEGVASVSHLFSVPSGTNVTFSMNVLVNSTLVPSPENDAGYSYSLTALYIPFDATGTDVAPFEPVKNPPKGR